MWRLGLIIVGTVVMAVFVWVAFYFWGFSRPIFKYENAFLPESRIFVKSNSIKKDLLPGDGLFIEVGQERDTFYCNEILCSNLIAQIRTETVLIRLNLNQAEVHMQVVSLFEPLKTRKDVGFISRYQTVMTSVKSLVPGWSYGASEVEQSKLKIFEGLGLIHLPDLKSDFWLTSNKRNKKMFLTPEIIQEMKRRGRAVLVEAIEKQSDADLAIGLGADAVIIEGHLRGGLKSNL